MMGKKPDLDEIKRLITGLQERRDKADQEVEKATDELTDYKRSVVQEKDPDGTNRVEIIFEFDKDLTFKHLEHKRKIALGARSDLDRRIKLLKGALRDVEKSLYELEL